MLSEAARKMMLPAHATGGPGAAPSAAAASPLLGSDVPATAQRAGAGGGRGEDGEGGEGGEGAGVAAFTASIERLERQLAEVQHDGRHRSTLPLPCASPLPPWLRCNTMKGTVRLCLWLARPLPPWLRQCSCMRSCRSKRA